jgi:hypothetical protein
MLEKSQVFDKILPLVEKSPDFRQRIWKVPTGRQGIAAGRFGTEINCRLF